MAAAGELCGFHNTCVLSLARADEEDNPAVFGYSRNYAAGSAEVGGGHVKRYDVDALSDAEDVARIGWVPEGGMMAEVSLRCE